MVYGSNMIEKAGSSLDITLKLCLARSSVAKKTPRRSKSKIKSTCSSKENLIHQNLPADTSAVWIRGKDLSEEIILEAHRIMTYNVRRNCPLGGIRTKAMFHELKCDLRQATTHETIDPIALASKYANIVVNIRPFTDGNG
ncbi:uncharacterized protein N7479_009055 [Penicillium vulpinum]|uniref:uncharacterized protein n=1 Tax=Penicillium vulpinum TaxID=29845 RepID=UPI0025484EE3|nr:uncharacterized protein N7479_009055 [Penicillium vulpinum]KAJ5950642.1 hypothetical protein N7479_009055 [Penicillium vulpinum]